MAEKHTDPAFSREETAQGELREAIMWLRRELSDLAARVERVVTVAANVERALGIPARSAEAEPEASDRDFATHPERTLSLSAESSELWQSGYPALPAEGPPNFAHRLERDLMDAAIRGSEREPQGSLAAVRELDFQELTSRLQRDLLELAARSPEDEIRAVVARSLAVARKTLSASAHAARAPVARQYFPKQHESESVSKVEGPKNLRVGELPDDVVAALRRSEMDARHAHLDSLMQD